MHPIVDFARDTLGVRLHPGQAEALSAYYESDCPNWLLLAGRRSGKSLLSDVICCYEALIPDFSGALRPGEERYILILSVRADNSMMHIRQIAKLLRHNRAIGKMIRREMQDRLELSNNVTILSLPASARAGRGFTSSCLLLDELAFFVDSLGNNSASEVYNALSPTVATFEKGRIVITTSVASKTGIIYDLYDRAQAGELDDFYVTKADTRSLNPKVSQRVIDNAMKRDPEAAEAEYYSNFREPTESFLDADRIDQAVDNGLSEVVKAQAGKTYVMAIDPATMRDRYALAVMHAEGDLSILDYAEALKPPVNPARAESLLLSLVERFNPAVIRCDQASTVIRLKSEIPRMEYCAFTRPFKLQIYGNLKEALNLGRLAIYRHQELIDELKFLQIRNSVDISAPKSGRVTHDDLADVTALCVDALASKKYSSSGWMWLPDPFETDEDDPDDLAEIIRWELEYQRPYNGKWHVNESHPPGTDWRNCPHRMKGCLACTRETQAERDAEAEVLKKITPISEQEYNEWRTSLRGRAPYQLARQAEEDARERKVKALFWNSFKNRKEG